MRPRFLTIAVVLLAVAIPVWAHVGSPDVYYDGDAGPYHLFVTVRVPQVIPGVAEIQIRSASGDVRTIQIVLLRLTGPGSNFPPTPDAAVASKEDPQFFTGSLWLMESGELQVRVLVDGAKGKGELSVPVASFAQRTLSMQRPMGVLLGCLMLFLAIALVSIAGAGSREARLEAGENPPLTNVRRARRVQAIAVVIVVALLYLGRAWWGAESSDYQRNVNFYKPPVAETTLENGNRLVIRAHSDEPKWSQRIKMEDVVPDHGHLMHLFLIRVPGMDRMWHLHPQRIEGGAFAEDLPAMSAGHYQVFADVVDVRGFPWTLVGSVDLPQIAGHPLAGDDSSWSGEARAAAPTDSTAAQLPDGGRIVWERSSDPLRAGAAMKFKFSVQDKDGKPAQDMEPYMGMAGHAEFVRSDLSVFAHVHPAGSVSMAALELAQSSLLNGGAVMPSGMAMTTPAPSTSLPPEVSFPYGFPQAGEYRIFVQIKRRGQIETGGFDAHVQ